MTNQIERPSAKIYQFPIRARAVPALAIDQMSAERGPTTAQHVSCDGWYHEAAIQADRTQQN